MMMEELKSQYIEQAKAFEQLENEINLKIAKKRQSIQRAQTAITKLEDKKWKLEYPHWINSLVKPIGEHFAKEFNKRYEIYGPFGIRAQTTIYWREDMTKSITEQPVLSLTIVPGDLSKGELYYETGKVKDKFAKNTIGDVNGMNREIALLPDSIEEIKKLITHEEA